MRLAKHVERGTAITQMLSSKGFSLVTKRERTENVASWLLLRITIVCCTIFEVFPFSDSVMPALIPLFHRAAEVKPKKKNPNRLIVDDAVNDDNSVRVCVFLCRCI
jgi:hypothetical protein